MSKTIITDQLNAVLEAAGIKVTKLELIEIEGIVELCAENQYNAATTATKICDVVDIQQITAYRALKNELITRKLFKN